MSPTTERYNPSFATENVAASLTGTNAVTGYLTDSDHIDTPNPFDLTSPSTPGAQTVSFPPQTEADSDHIDTPNPFDLTSPSTPGAQTVSFPPQTEADSYHIDTPNPFDLTSPSTPGAQTVTEAGTASDIEFETRSSGQTYPPRAPEITDPAIATGSLEVTTDIQDTFPSEAAGTAFSLSTIGSHTLARTSDSTHSPGITEPLQDVSSPANGNWSTVSSNSPLSNDLGETSVPVTTEHIPETNSLLQTTQYDINDTSDNWSGNTSPSTPGAQTVTEAGTASDIEFETRSSGQTYPPRAPEITDPAIATGSLEVTTDIQDTFPSEAAGTAFSLSTIGSHTLARTSDSTHSPGITEPLQDVSSPANGNWSTVSSNSPLSNDLGETSVPVTTEHIPETNSLLQTTQYDINDTSDNWSGNPVTSKEGLTSWSMTSTEEGSHTIGGK